MKIRNIFMSLLAALFVATGCEVEKLPELAELQVSQSIIGFDAENPKAVQVTFTATGSWEIVTADGKEFPSWFTVNPLTGGEGETVVTFTAAGADKVAHESDLNVKVGDEIQHLIVKQGVQSKEIVPCGKIAKEGVEGATYYVHATIKEVKNSTYGNLLLEDESGTLDVYGTLNDNGEEAHFTDLGLSVGDEIWAHGPFKPYKGTPQLKNITVDKFKKSLLKIDKTSVKLNAAGQEEYTEEDSEEVLTRPFALTVSVKGETIKCELPEWISIKAINPSKGATEYVFAVQPFEVAGESRETEIVFTSTQGSNESVVRVKVKQRGLPAAIQELTIDKFLEAAVSDSKEYQISGIIKEIKKEEYGNIILQDGKAEVYVYGLTKEKVEKNDKSFKSLGLKVGDYVTVIGKRGEFNKNPQMVGGYYKSSVKVVASSIADFLKGKVYEKSQRYLLEGKVTKIDMEDGQPKPYGNLTIEDKTGSVYVYGLVNAPGYYEKDGKIKFSNNKSFPAMNIKVGDTIKICSFLGEFNGNKQAVESYVLPGTLKEEEVKPEPGKPSFEGDGKSAATAYTVADAIKYFEAGMDSNAEVWVKGPIAGYFDGGKPNLLTDLSDINKVQASNMGLGTKDQFITVQLSSNTDPRAALNLKDHPENLGKTVAVYGKIQKYFGIAGVKSVTKFELK